MKDKLGRSGQGRGKTSTGKKPYGFVSDLGQGREESGTSPEAKSEQGPLRGFRPPPRGGTVPLVAPLSTLHPLRSKWKTHEARVCTEVTFPADGSKSRPISSPEKIPTPMHAIACSFSQKLLSLANKIG